MPEKEQVSKPREEPVLPGYEVGESRDLGPGGGAASLPGRAPRTRVEVHPRRDEAGPSASQEG